MPYDSYVDVLRLKLSGPLPGTDAQFQMAPDHRKMPTKHKETPYEAAVLLLLYPLNGRIYIILTQRPEYNGHHSGQISFPGGKREASDKSLQNTALRETHEELGIKPDRVNILGKLSSLFIPVSNFIVQPLVGFIPIEPEIVPDSFEVEKVIKTPLRQFFDDNIVLYKHIIHEGNTIKIPYYNVAGDHVWGATAMILSEFIELHKRHSIIPE